MRLAAASVPEPARCLPSLPPPPQIFFEEQWDDILAANPALFAHGLADRKALLSAASIYWWAGGGGGAMLAPPAQYAG